MVVCRRSLLSAHLEHMKNNYNYQFYKILQEASNIVRMPIKFQLDQFQSVIRIHRFITYTLSMVRYNYLHT